MRGKIVKSKWEWRSGIGSKLVGGEGEREGVSVGLLTGEEGGGGPPPNQSLFVLFYHII